MTLFGLWRHGNEPQAHDREFDQIGCTQARRIADRRGGRKPAAKANPEFGRLHRGWACGTRRDPAQTARHARPIALYAVLRQRPRANRRTRWVAYDHH